MKQNSYTAKDIERYHSGELSPAEMHAMEKAALDDPFLSDALEGYAFTQTASSDLSTLQQRLENRIQKEKKKPVFFIGNTWMKIAALFVLFAGGGWLVFRTLSGNQEQIATAPNTEKAPATSTTVAADSQQVFTDSSVTTQTVAAEKLQDRDGLVNNNLKAASSNRQQNTQIPPVTFAAPIADSSRSDVYAHVRISPPAGNRFYDTGSIASNASNAANAKAREQFPARSAGVTSDTIKNFDVVLQRSNDNLEEVVVTQGLAKPAAKRKMQVTVDTLEPAAGWTNFDDYIASNLKMPEEFKAKPVNGEVELAFDVNKKGEAVNITVIKSLCEKCDEEAVRLLKEGPKWKKNKKKGKVKIKFPLAP